MEPTRQPQILLIASEEHLWIYSDKLEDTNYQLTDIFQEWNENPQLQKDPRVQEHSGPLCNGFVEALTEKDPKKYSLVLVELLTEDLISPLKKSGYQGPVVVIGNPEREDYPVPFVKLGPSFDRRLKTTLEGCLT